MGCHLFCAPNRGNTGSTCADDGCKNRFQLNEKKGGGGREEEGRNLAKDNFTNST